MLDYRNEELKEAIEETADRIARRLVKPAAHLEPNRGPYQAISFFDNGHSIHKARLGTFETLSEIAQAAIERIRLTTWVEVIDRDGQVAACLDPRKGWDILAKPEKDGALVRAYEKALASGLDAGRCERALQTASTEGAVKQNGGGYYTVRSLRNGSYSVWRENGGWSCECKDYEFGHTCYHIIAVWLTIKADGLERKRREAAPPAPRKVKIGADGKRSKMWK